MAREASDQRNAAKARARAADFRKRAAEHAAGADACARSLAHLRLAYRHVRERAHTLAPLELPAHFYRDLIVAALRYVWHRAAAAGNRLRTWDADTDAALYERDAHSDGYEARQMREEAQRLQWQADTLALDERARQAGL